MIHEMNHVFADRVGSALVQEYRRRFVRHQNFNEAPENGRILYDCEMWRLQRGGVELSKQVNAAEARVDAIGNRMSTNRYAGKGTAGLGVPSSAETARALTAAHDEERKLLVLRTGGLYMMTL